jgi:release factor glutamine methyltransferase
VRPTQVVRHAAEYLERHGVESPLATAEILLASVLGTDRAGVHVRSDGLTSGEARSFGRALCQRCTGTPLQHLTGEQQFRRVTVQVRPGVFVPRPETEVLVEAALETIGNRDEPLVVDVGTGTGAVALAIKDERPDAQVLATDLSPEAVELAARNAARLDLDVRVVQGDLLEPLPSELRGWVDLVVSNPPYVRATEYEDLPPEVKADPPMALFGDVEVYRRLAVDAARWLADGGSFVVEIGAGHADEVVDALAPAFADLRVLHDLAGRNRIVAGRRT